MKKFLCLLTSVILSYHFKRFPVSAYTSDTPKTISNEYTQNSYIYEITTTEDEPFFL